MRITRSARESLNVGSMQTLTLRIHGMTCGACVERIERALRATPGVVDASVQLMTESALVTVEEAENARAAAVEQVRRAGYDAEIIPDGGRPAARAATEEDAAAREKMRRHRQALIQAVGLVLPILAVEHLRHHLWSADPGSQTAARLLQFALLVMLAVSPAGAPILVGGVRALLHRAPNMDLLITLGFVVAVISSAFGTFIARDEAFVHIHAAAMILGLVCVGRYLEARARGRAAAAMSALARLAPRSALVMRGDDFVSLPVEQVRVGDVVRVPPHVAIPADGVVLIGHATVDESLMTGEPLPQSRGPGDPVLGGSVVTAGSLELRVTATGAQATLGRIARLVSRTQASKSAMQRLADRVAAIFTPVVVVLAALTFAGWIVVEGRDALDDAARCAIAVLVIACPCALGLATPAAIAVASGRAARQGILVRDAATFEALAAVDTVVWDKTGTLTAARPVVHQVKPLGAFDERELLRLAASAEQFSVHPFARAVEACARRLNAEPGVPDAFESVPGEGVIAKIEGREVLVGKPAFLERRGVQTEEIRRLRTLDPSVPRASADAQARRSFITVAVDGKLAGVLALVDPTRPSSAGAVSELKKLGIESELLTGDAEPVARAVADDVGIAAVCAERNPEDKVARVAQLRVAGRRVAMVGDGVNDAAALVAADVGVAFATGSDVACEAAGINLIGSTPHLVPRAVALARACVRVIRQNLFWAFFYNVLMIPLAVIGIVPPSLAAGAMMVSSLTVVLNALRLRAPAASDP